MRCACLRIACLLSLCLLSLLLLLLLLLPTGGGTILLPSRARVRLPSSSVSSLASRVSALAFCLFLSCVPSFPRMSPVAIPSSPCVSSPLARTLSFPPSRASRVLSASASCFLRFRSSLPCLVLSCGPVSCTSPVPPSSSSPPSPPRCRILFLPLSSPPRSAPLPSASTLSACCPPLAAPCCSSSCVPNASLHLPAPAALPLPPLPSVPRPLPLVSLSSRVLSRGIHLSRTVLPPPLITCRFTFM